MKVNIRRLAPVGLYLALVSALAAGGYFIVQKRFDWVLGLFLGLIVIGIALYGILDPGRVRQALTGRQARYGSNATIITIAFLGILVVVNVLIYNTSTRWDLTQDKTHTLAAETIDALKKVKGKITAEAFFTARISSQTARQLLTDFKANSGGNFDFKFIDPEADPVAAQMAKITQDGSIVVQLDGRQEVVKNVAEQDLTAAIIRLSASGQKTVYFLTGHGEYDPNGSDDSSLGQAKTALETKSYVVKQLSLITEHQIPADAAVIVVAGAQKPVSADEVNLIKAFVDKGGGLIVMSDPTPVTQFGDSPDPLADYMDQSWGVKLVNDFVIDLSAQPNSVAVADPNGYGNHAITDNLKGKVVVFPAARSVQIRSMDNITQVTLAKTSTQSWAETDLAALRQNQIQFNQGTDIAGPVPLAVAADNSTTTARVVVIGNSGFAINAYFARYGNEDFFMNSVDWTAKQDSLINLTAKSTTQRVLVPPQTAALGLILLGSVFVLPGSILAIGIMVWVQRRRRG
jgi:ABC-type uncharacterized transport system involved in gliding motility auxiliary subunit